MPVTANQTEHPLSHRDAYRDVGGSATQDAKAERARERGYKYRQLAYFIPGPSLRSPQPSPCGTTPGMEEVVRSMEPEPRGSMWDSNGPDPTNQ